MNGHRAFLFISALKGEGASLITERVKATLDELQKNGPESSKPERLMIDSIDGFLHDPDSVSKISSADAAIIVVRVQVTDRSDVRELAQCIVRYETVPLGVVATGHKEAIPRFVRKLMRFP